MGPRYVLKFLIRENDKISNNSAANEVRLKISTDMESLDFHNLFLMYIRPNPKPIKFYIIKLGNIF